MIVARIERPVRRDAFYLASRSPCRQEKGKAAFIALILAPPSGPSGVCRLTISPLDDKSAANGRLSVNETL